MKILLATRNEHKLIEIKNKLNNPEIEIITLNDLADVDEVEETEDTFIGNAYLKAKHYFDKFNIPTLSDDSGLVCLYNGLPGVKSARFAGEKATSLENNLKLLDELKGVTNRDAYFISLLCLVTNDNTYTFEGRLNGRIGYDFVGNNGFGYDSLFIIEDGRTLAELSLEEKNEISHRGQAIDKLAQFLKSWRDK